VQPFVQLRFDFENGHGEIRLAPSRYRGREVDATQERIDPLSAQRVKAAMHGAAVQWQTWVESGRSGFGGPDGQQDVRCGKANRGGMLWPNIRGLYEAGSPTIVGLPAAELVILEALCVVPDIVPEND
jgi:hypothetical protein